jgi:hypothetical protein
VTAEWESDPVVKAAFANVKSTTDRVATITAKLEAAYLDRIRAYRVLVEHGVPITTIAARQGVNARAVRQALESKRATALD